jgi:hypothetical protein
MRYSLYILEMKQELIHIINNSFDLKGSETDILKLLAERINFLIMNDFNKLIHILYRADINEKKLNHILSQNKDEDAGKLIAILYVERHLQKIKSRQDNRRENNDITEEEKW